LSLLKNFTRHDKIKTRSKFMSEAQTMTLDERISIGLKALALEKQGKKEEGERIFKQIPMSPYLAKLIKEDWKAGDWLKESGWNLSEAEAAFGPGWLDR
jgi:hypothetical protein